MTWYEAVVFSTTLVTVVVYGLDASRWQCAKCFRRYWPWQRKSCSACLEDFAKRFK